MFKNTLIIGCGLIGSSILRSSIKNKISKNFYVFEKSKKNKQIIKKINSKIIFVSNLNKDIDKMNFEKELDKAFQQNNLFGQMIYLLSPSSYLSKAM